MPGLEYGFVVALVGAIAVVVGWFLGRSQARHQAQAADAERRLQEQRLEAEQVRLHDLEGRLSEVESEREQWRRQYEERGQRIAELEARQEEERRNAGEKLELLQKNRDELKREFENLANRIFEQKSDAFREKSQHSLQQLLSPFRDQLKDFRERVDTIHSDDNKERQALRTQIENLQQLNHQMSEEASNLTRALKGDKKVQGNWGELILERVLERSGLRKGVEYETQGSYRGEDGRQLRPDVVVHLPDRRNVVIDSKVSLVAYQDFVIAEDDESREQALRAHIEAVRQHIRTLSEKDYSHLEGLESPDFVLLFMPIEPAFIAAFQQDEQLFAEAFNKKVVVVTPTTLLATLRTIENIWRYERQSQNARRIAERAGAVYDKLRVFVEAMERLGNQMETAQKSYDSAMNTLAHGRGNLISQAHKFESLGVRVKKELPRSVLEKADLDDSGDEDDDVLDEPGHEDESPSA